MNKSVNRIKINKDLWFTVLGNKLVFGNSKNKQGYHHTVSYGNKSGHFDLHLKNEKTGKYFTVFKISHQNVLETLPQLINKIQNSFLDLKKIDEALLKEKELEFYEIGELDDLTEEFNLITKKDRVIIDKDSEEFKAFVDRLLSKHKTIKSDYKILTDKNKFNGIAKLGSDNYFIIKSPYLGNDIYILNNMDLSIESVLSKILGHDVYEEIIARINQGICEIEK